MKKKENPVICWWSGGITSAVACKLSIDIFGKDNCRIVMIDTHNEDGDTYRFMKDCENWYGKEIESISNIPEVYGSIEDVWYKYNSLNVANGAVCSSELKRKVREKFCKNNNYSYQVFGFEFDKKEFNRALSLKKNYPKINPIFPLLMYGYDKEECLNIVRETGIEFPVVYQYGFRNNNCFRTGCVQGGIGYWQKMKKEFPDKFNYMAKIEHDLTDRKGKPVTMLKDQSKKAKESGNILVFLKKHPDYLDNKSIDDMFDCEVKPLKECNGFCGVNDLINRSETEKQINFDD